MLQEELEPISLGVVHKGHPQKRPVFLLPLILFFDKFEQTVATYEVSQLSCPSDTRKWVTQSIWIFRLVSVKSLTYLGGRGLSGSNPTEMNILRLKTLNCKKIRPNSTQKPLQKLFSCYVIGDYNGLQYSTLSPLLYLIRIII